MFHRCVLSLVEWTPITKVFVTLNICNFDQVLSHQSPTRKNCHACAGRKTEQWKKLGGDKAQANEDVIYPGALSHYIQCTSIRHDTKWMGSIDSSPLL